MGRRVTGLVAAALLITATLGWPAGSSAAQPPSGEATALEPTLGPLFLAGLGRAHHCSASVLASASRDLVITAAHCLTGSGAGVQFAPGYRDGNTPYGVWTAVQAYVDPSWTANQDPRHDVAILKIARQQRAGRWLGVQDVVGANQLGVAPSDGAWLRVPAYPAGLDDEPISCQSPLYRTEGYSSFDCPGYVGGTSGAPFLLPAAPAAPAAPSQAASDGGGGRADEGRVDASSADASSAVDGGAVYGDGGEVIVGVIGGLHQGGCSADTSYASAFGPAIYLLRQRATAGLSPDVLPRAGSANC